VGEVATTEIYVAGFIGHDMVKARRWINQAQVFLERIGGHDLLRAWMLNNIGVVLDANGDREGAASELFKALRIKERVLGKDHPDVAYTLVNLAAVLSGIGRSKEALEFSNRGVEIVGGTFGASHPRLVIQLANRADILNQLGRYDEARRDAERAIAIQSGELGPQENLIYALGPLGEALLGLAQPSKALQPIQRALKLAEEAGIEEELPRLRFALARALWDSGRDRKAARAMAAELAVRKTKDAKVGDPEESIRIRAAAWLATHPVIPAHPHAG
jgi:eukaryotic-like serine/threonine-protein kinase